MKEYIKEASKFMENKKLEIIDMLNTKITLNKDFIPLEIMMFLENIIANSKKAKATNITISNGINEYGQIFFKFSDNGNGIKDSRYIKNIDLIFDKGETTTNGSGIGLYHAKKIINKLSGKISVPNYINGFTLEVLFE